MEVVVEESEKALNFGSSKKVIYDCLVVLSQELDVASAFALIKCGDGEHLHALLEKSPDLLNTLHRRSGKTLLQYAIASGNQGIADVVRDAMIQKPKENFTEFILRITAPPQDIVLIRKDNKDVQIMQKAINIKLNRLLGISPKLSDSEVVKLMVTFCDGIWTAYRLINNMRCINNDYNLSSFMDISSSVTSLEGTSKTSSESAPSTPHVLPDDILHDSQSVVSRRYMSLCPSEDDDEERIKANGNKVLYQNNNQVVNDTKMGLISTHESEDCSLSPLTNHLQSASIDEMVMKSSLTVIDQGIDIDLEQVVADLENSLVQRNAFVSCGLLDFSST